MIVRGVLVISASSLTSFLTIKQGGGVKRTYDMRYIVDTALPCRGQDIMLISAYGEGLVIFVRIG